jgi:hypothetical protein
MEREVAQGQLTVVLDMGFDPIGLHGLFLNERFGPDYTPTAPLPANMRATQEEPHCTALFLYPGLRLAVIVVLSPHTGDANASAVWHTTWSPASDEEL